MVELASIIILGIFAQWLAWRFKVPAILPLILIGLAVGPFAPFWMSEEFLHGQDKWLNPIYNGKSGLFPGDNLFYFVELAIGIILFEGGLTLKRNEISSIGSIVGKLITLGSLVTFACATLAAHFIIDLSWSLSFLFAGLIIVTGPTVIAPILRNIPLKKDVANILKWEGILIDPIGALAAVLVYEFLASNHSCLRLKRSNKKTLGPSLSYECIHPSGCAPCFRGFRTFGSGLRTIDHSRYGNGIGQY